MALALKMNVLARENQQKLRYDLAQLLLTQREYTASLTHLYNWLENAKHDEINPAIYIRLGNVYLQTKNYSKASEHFELALSASEKPVEYHNSLLLASYVLEERFNKAVNLLKRMLVLFPDKKKYPLQLVALYDQTRQSNKALEVLERLYQQGMFDDTAEYTTLAYRLLNAGYPLKAATLLQQGIDNFNVWRTIENLNLLAQCCIDTQPALCGERRLPIGHQNA